VKDNSKASALPNTLLFDVQHNVLCKNFHIFIISAVTICKPCIQIA